MAGGCCRSPGFRVTFRKDMLRSLMRRRLLRPAFCMTGHSQQSADDVRLKHPGRQNVPEPRLPGALIGILPRHKPARRRVGRSLPPGRREIREQSPSRQLRLSATDASYRSGWRQMQLAVDCGLRVVDHKLWIATGKVKIISLTSTLWRRAEHRPVRQMEPFSFHQAHWPRLCGSRWRAGVANEFHHKSDQPS